MAARYVMALDIRDLLQEGRAQATEYRIVYECVEGSLACLSRLISADGRVAGAGPEVVH